MPPSVGPSQGRLCCGLSRPACWGGQGEGRLWHSCPAFCLRTRGCLRPLSRTTLPARCQDGWGGLCKFSASCKLLHLPKGKGPLASGPGITPDEDDLSSVSVYRHLGEHWFSKRAASCTNEYPHLFQLPSCPVAGDKPNMVIERDLTGRVPPHFCVLGCFPEPAHSLPLVSTGGIPLVQVAWWD